MLFRLGPDSGALDIGKLENYRHRDLGGDGVNRFWSLGVCRFEIDCALGYTVSD